MLGNKLNYVNSKKYFSELTVYMDLHFYVTMETFSGSYIKSIYNEE